MTFHTKRYFPVRVQFPHKINVNSQVEQWLGKKTKIMQYFYLRDEVILKSPSTMTLSFVLMKPERSAPYPLNGKWNFLWKESSLIPPGFLNLEH